MTAKNKIKAEGLRKSLQFVYEPSFDIWIICRYDTPVEKHRLLLFVLSGRVKGAMQHMKMKRAVNETAGATPSVCFVGQTHCFLIALLNGSKKCVASHKSLLLAIVLICIMSFSPLFLSSVMAEKQKGSMRNRLTQKTLQTVNINREIVISDGLSVWIDRYEVCETFQYSPVGGFSSVILSAKEGYRLLCLYLRVENRTDEAVDMLALRNMDLFADGFPSVRACSSFFQTKQERHRVRPFQIKTHTILEGYLLYVLPEDALASDAQLTAALFYENNEYSCLLRPDEAEG